jgi:hypothetical protein
VTVVGKSGVMRRVWWGTMIEANRLILPLVAAVAVPCGAVDFVKEVQPVLEANCYDCHGEDKQKNGLRLDSVAGILKGSDSGEPLFVRGSSGESLLIRMVTSTDPKHMMPPKGERLKAEEVVVLKAWIDGGAAMPGEKEAAAGMQLKTDHWSFQPVRRPEVPGVVAGGSEIDAFVGAKLKEKGMEALGEADRRTLVRRVYQVMHGLPPSPAESEGFVRDERPEAWGELVEKVLASPRRGERWARHWLDVVRYADTNGFETNRERKTAYHYRDWVIESINEDKPYDQFVREQIAGDALGVDAATGFLVAGAYDIVKSPDPNLSLMQRQEELADMVSTTSTAFMGLTMGCARCHNHKFDPVLQKDYYAMQAVFAGVNHGERAIRRELGEEEAKRMEMLRTEAAGLREVVAGFRQKAAAASGGVAKRAAVNARENEEVFAATEVGAVRFTIEACSGAEPCVDELEIYDEGGKNVALASGGAVAKASGSLAGYPIHKLEHVNDGQSGNARSWIADTAGKGWVEVVLPAKAKVKRIVWGRDRNGQFGDRVATSYRFEGLGAGGEWTVLATSEDRMPFGGQEAPDAFVAKLGAGDAVAAREALGSLAAVEAKVAALSGAASGWVGTFSQPGRTHRLYRGEPQQPREEVAPDVVTVMGTLGMGVDEPEQERRVKFARWLTGAEHPLTARVMVNRIWHYIFGQGIVSTPSDFGLNGARPTHPELLDWLADEFVRSGWSVKHVQRLILRSAAFRRSSGAGEPVAGDAGSEKNRQVDAGGEYLWRFTPRRLEAEAIRDAMLTVSGVLEMSGGGPGFYLMDVVEENVMHYFAKEKFGPAEFRRMVYQFRIRQTTDSVFSSFDCPDGGQVMPKRSRSNTPLQALNLFNSTFVLGQAGILEERLRKEAGADVGAQAERAFALFYNRAPDAWEREQSVAMIEAEGLGSFCRALYNSSEFLFVF